MSPSTSSLNFDCGANQSYNSLLYGLAPGNCFVFPIYRNISFKSGGVLKKTFSKKIGVGVQ